MAKLTAGLEPLKDRIHMAAINRKAAGSSSTIEKPPAAL